MKGWTFYESRQPSDPAQLQNIAITVSENDQVDVESLLIQASVDDVEKRIDIVALHPVFEQLSNGQRYRILFILLDEALGEFGTQTWIGGIDIRLITIDEQHTRSLMLLPEYIGFVERFHAWKKLSPTESNQVYELPSELDRARGDTVVGSTAIRSVIGDFFAGKGKL